MTQPPDSGNDPSESSSDPNESNPPPPPPMPMPPPLPSDQYQAPYGAPPVAEGMYYDQASGLTLPQGTVLAPVGRRIGAYFLSLALAIVTLGIGYLIWGLIVWGRGTSPALSVLGMRAWDPVTGRPAGWWRMALRDIVGGIVQSILGFITGVVSLVLFLSTKEHRSILDFVGGTVIIHDPNKVIDGK
jgi:uncharacterized RDD family membrane protein YckC